MKRRILSALCALCMTAALAAPAWAETYSVTLTEGEALADVPVLLNIPAQTPAAAGVKGLVPVETLDYIYRKSRNFDSLNKNLAAQVLREAKEKDVVYCVDGSVTEDVSAQILIAKRKDVRIFDGPSKSARAFAAAKARAVIVGNAPDVNVTNSA